MANKNTGKTNTKGSRATMNNTSRFDDDGYGIRNLKKPGDNGKKKNVGRKK